MRMGDEGDPRLMAEFLRNMPSEYNQNDELGVVFMALTPDQQVKVLSELKKLYKFKRIIQIEAMDLAISRDDELALVIGVAIPDVMIRIAFWEKFLESKAAYKKFSRSLS